jgi:hypothetical protein
MGYKGEKHPISHEKPVKDAPQQSIEKIFTAGIRVRQGIEKRGQGNKRRPPQIQFRK